jgi:V/A-type H+-transporting ATPase subunit C
MLLKRDTGNCAYAIARVKTRKRFLLKREDYLRMLGMEPSAIARFIGESQYAKDVHEFGLKFTGADLIEYAVYAHLARSYSEVLGFCQGDLNVKVGEYMRRWDVYNIKTAMRGKMYGEDPSRLSLSFVPAGILKKECLKTMASCDGVDGIIETLRWTDYHEPLIEERGRMGSVRSLEKLENALDRHYYTTLLRRITAKNRADAAYLAFLKREIDIINIRTILTLKRDGLGAQAIGEYLLPGGMEVRGEMLNSILSSEGFDATLTSLETLSFFEEMRQFIPDAKETLIPLERALEKYIARSARSFSYIDPLSVLPVIDYVLNTKLEVDNIRILVRGKERGMGESRIRDLLMLG